MGGGKMYLCEKLNLCVMKNIVFLSLFLISILNVSAQKCKYDVDKKDPFSGESVKTINTTLIRNGLNWTSSKTGNNYSVELSILFNASSYEIMGIDDTVLVKLKNGDTFTLRPMKEVAPIKKVFDGRVVSVYVQQFQVEKTVFEKLSKSPIQIVRVQLDKAYDLDFTDKKEKNCKELMEASACMLLD
jgi:hypothetical protein